MPPSREHTGSQGGGGGLAVRTGDRDAAVEAHQLGQHFGARHHRNALRARRQALHVVGLDGAGNHHHIGAIDMRRRMAFENGRAQGLQALGRLTVVLVRTADLITQGHHDFGDAAHAGAADADEMHPRECPGQSRLLEANAVSRCHLLNDYVRHLLGRLRKAAAPGRLLPSARCVRGALARRARRPPDFLQPLVLPVIHQPPPALSGTRRSRSGGRRPRAGKESACWPRRRR